MNREHRSVPDDAHSLAVWLTGRPCSGKTTIALLLTERLTEGGAAVELLDGDELRRNLSADLGFSPADRLEHARRVACAARAAIEAGRLPVVALISPTEQARQTARGVLGDAFVEVHVDASPDVCERRDVKGMYREARAGLRAEFTGVSADYEAPRAPALRLATDASTPAACVDELLALLRGRGVAAAGAPARS